MQLSSVPNVDSARSTIARAVDGVGGGEDHRPVDPLQQVAGEHRPAGERQGAVEHPPGRVGITPGEVDLGQPLQAVGLATAGAEVVVQLDGFLQLAGREVEVARQHGRFADQRGGEGHGPQRAAAQRGVAQAAGRGDHVGVRRRPVQQVLGRAEVAVEQRVGDGRDVARVRRSSPRIRSNHSPRWWAMRPSSDTRSSTCHVWSPPEHAAPSLVGDGDRTVEVGAEEGGVALGEEDLAVVGAAVERHPVEGGVGGLDVAGHDRATRQPGAQPAAVVRRGELQRLAERADRGRVAERHEHVGAQGGQPGAVRARGARPGGVDQRRARRGTRRATLPSRPPRGGGGRPGARRRRGRGGGRCAPARRRPMTGARRRHGGSDGAGAAAHRGATPRAPGDGGSGSRSSPVRARRGRWPDRGARTPRRRAARSGRRTRRCRTPSRSTPRAAGARGCRPGSRRRRRRRSMPSTSARSPRGGPAAAAGTGCRRPARRCRRGGRRHSGRGWRRPARAPASSASGPMGRSSTGPRPSGERPISSRRRRAAGQQQEHPRVGEGAGQVVQQPDGGVVGVVDVVDRQHRASASRRPGGAARRRRRTVAGACCRRPTARRPRRARDRSRRGRRRQARRAASGGDGRGR